METQVVASGASSRLWTRLRAETKPGVSRGPNEHLLALHIQIHALECFAFSIEIKFT